MNAKYCISMAADINGATYQMLIPLGVPYVDCKAAAQQFLNDIEELEKNAIDQANAAQKQSEDIKPAEDIEAIPAEVVEAN